LYDVSVSGLGKAGLPLAAVMADSGLKVIGIDVSESVVASVNAGKCHVDGEPLLPELLAKHGGKNLCATTDGVAGVKESKLHVAIVPLFIDADNKPDFSILKSAFAIIGKGLKKGDAVVIETTVPVGTTAGLLANILEKESGLKAGEDFYLAHSPERIMTGFSVSRFKEFPKVVGGINGESTAIVKSFYEKFCGTVIPVRDSNTAEFTKIAEGIYRDVNIALANELFIAAKKFGVDFWEVRKAAAHSYCNLLEAGNGVGGHCIPVYPWFLINEMEMPLSKTARQVNDGMAEYFAGMVESKVMEGGKVAVVGLTYREGVKENAYTRSKPLINLLKKKFSVFGIDSLLSAAEMEKEFGVPAFEGKDFSQFDCVVLLHKDASFAGALKQAKSFVDTKNVLGKS